MRVNGNCRLEDTIATGLPLPLVVVVVAVAVAVVVEVVLTSSLSLVVLPLQPITDQLSSLFALLPVRPWPGRSVALRHPYMAVVLALLLSAAGVPFME